MEIRITGLRPGEKLFEEIALEGEDVLPTHHEKIRIFNGKGIGAEILAPWITQLQSLIEQRDEKKVLNHLTELVPEYNVPELPKFSRPEVVRLTSSNGLERGCG